MPLIAEGEDPACFSAFPALDPIRNIHSSIPSEIDIGTEKTCYEWVHILDPVPGSIRFDGEGQDPAVLGTPREITEEEVVAVSLAKPQSRVVHEPRWTTGDIGDRGDDPCRLMFMALVPQAFLVPWPAQVVPCETLVFHAPTGSTALGDVNQSCPVSTVGVVVAREEGSIVIKGDFLGISQPCMEDLESRAIGVATEHCPRSGIDEVFTLLVHHVVATITDRPVEPPVGTPCQAVHVMATKRYADSKSTEDLLLHIGNVLPWLRFWSHLLPGLSAQSAVHQVGASFVGSRPRCRRPPWVATVRSLFYALG